MATKQEQGAERHRRGYWIRLARKRIGLTQTALAQLLGYKGNSLSTVSLWESGKRQVPSDKFGGLARHLHLPPGFLVSPPLTDDERLDAAVRDAEELERQDSAAEPAQAPPTGVVRAVGPRRRTA